MDPKFTVFALPALLIACAEAASDDGALSGSEMPAPTSPASSDGDGPASTPSNTSTQPTTPPASAPSQSLSPMGSSSTPPPATTSAPVDEPDPAPTAVAAGGNPAIPVGGGGGTAPTAGGGEANGAAGSSAGTGGGGGESSAGAGGGTVGGSGGASPVGPSAVAVITTTGVDPGHDDVVGSATFTLDGDEVTLVLELQNCAMGPHISHIHTNPSCDNEGNAGGNHWLPNGELLTDYSCEADGTVSYTLSISTDQWTIGTGDDTTDVDGRSFMVHNGSAVSPGDRVACGVIELQ
jgi:Cu/Zn superoxide dismutase